MEENKVVTDVIDDLDWTSEGFDNEDLDGGDMVVTIDELAAEVEPEDEE